MSQPVNRRRYDAAGRREQAAQSQLHVLRTAVGLFLGQGYARTTMKEIAAAAGVSVETVYGTYRSKAALLHRAWDITIGGDDRAVMFHDRPEVRAIRAEPDLATRLRMHARLTTSVAARVAPFTLMLQASAGAEPAAEQMLAEIGRQRRAGLSVMAREAAASGRLAVTEQEACDVLWSMSDGLLWHRLVVDCAWTDEQYAGWLGEVWVSTLVRR
jgi:AcrR family transcriptional regulator